MIHVVLDQTLRRMTLGTEKDRTISNPMSIFFLNRNHTEVKSVADRPNFLLFFKLLMRDLIIIFTDELQMLVSSII